MRSGIDSFSDAKFGKTIIEFTKDGGHVAIYYGTDKNGTHYFYSKMFTQNPVFTTLEEMQATTNYPNDYKLYNIIK